MELRYRMAVVTGAGGGLGRDIAVALGRRGMSVLVADPDAAAAERTAALVRESRVVAWAFQGDLTSATEVRLLAARASDLGGADCLVVGAGSSALLARAFVENGVLRRTSAAPAAVVDVARGPSSSARSTAVCAAVLDLLADAGPGQVVEVVGTPAGTSPG